MKNFKTIRNLIALIIAFILGGYLFDIFGSHEVCQKNYDAYQKAFWPTDSIKEDKIDIKSKILDSIGQYAIEDFVEFNPDTTKSLVVHPKRILKSQHNNLKCCYPVAMFEHFAFFQKTLKYDVYITKGRRDVKDSTGATKSVVIFMFRLYNPVTKTSGLYDIVDDPNGYDALGDPECK